MPLPVHDIAGYQLTHHAFRRAMQRRIDPQQIADAIEQPVRRAAQDASGTTFKQASRAGVVVVIDVVSKQVITVAQEQT